MSAEFMKSKFVCSPSVLQLFLNLMHSFLSNLVVASFGPYAEVYLFIYLFIFFWILLRIFFVFVNMGLYGSDNFKTLPLLQFPAKGFQIFPEFSS